MVSVVGFFMASVVAGNLLYGFRRWLLYVVAGKRCLMVSVAGFWVDSAPAGGSNILECIERFLVFVVFLGLASVAGFFMVSVVTGKRCFMFSVVGFCMALWFPSWQGTLLNGFRRWFLFMVSGCYRTLRWKPEKKIIRTFPWRYIYIYIYIYTYIHTYTVYCIYLDLSPPGVHK